MRTPFSFKEIINYKITDNFCRRFLVIFTNCTIIVERTIREVHRKVQTCLQTVY